MNEELLERLGEKIDSLINLLYSMDLQMPATIHLEALKGSIPEVTNELIKIHSEGGGENIWDDEKKLK